MTELNITSACRLGCVRHNNEDMILVQDQFVRNDECLSHIILDATSRCLVAVADGMGGHRSGDVASSEALHNLHFFFSDIPVGLNTDSFKDLINEWLLSINMIFDSKGKTDASYKGMGTTLVAIAFYEGKVYSLNCGDSRLYRYRSDGLKQLTIDHSLSNLRGDEIRTSIITNCIGGGCTSSYFDIVQLDDDIQDGDVYLLCSDGLTDMMNDNHLQYLLSKGSDANELCHEAIAFGGYDNVSACLIQVRVSND